MIVDDVFISNHGIGLVTQHMVFPLSNPAFGAKLLKWHAVATKDIL
jgi:hypothetical protein